MSYSYSRMGLRAICGTGSRSGESVKAHLHISASQVQVDFCQHFKLLTCLTHNHVLHVKKRGALK